MRDRRKCRYNVSYLAELQKIVGWAAAEGIYTVLDWHQDLLSERFCGEGIPNWALNKLCAVRVGAVPSESLSLGEPLAIRLRLQNISCSNFPQPAYRRPFPVDNETGDPSIEQCSPPIVTGPRKRTNSAPIARAR